MSSKTTFLVSMTEDEMRTVLHCIEWTKQTLFDKKKNDFPIMRKEAMDVGYRIDCMLIDHWAVDNVVR